MLLKQAQLSAARLHKLSALLQESDADGRGGYTSHFELYMEAMQQAGAHVGLIHAFVAALAEGTEAKQALQELGAPLAVQHFVGTTLDIAENGTTAEVCASFFFGREELIPGLFGVLLESLKANGMAIDRLEYYLERHMEIQCCLQDDRPKAVILAYCARMCSATLKCSDVLKVLETSCTIMSVEVSMPTGTHIERYLSNCLYIVQSCRCCPMFTRLA